MERWARKTLQDFGLKKWVFAFKVTTSSEEYASVDIDHSGFFATIYFSPRFFTCDYERQLWCLLHEGTHCHLARYAECVENLIHFHVPLSQQEAVRQGLSVVEESAVDALSQAVALKHFTNT